MNPLDPPASLRVNDVYTPEVTRLLGERLGAGWIINRGQDRNALDLNRTTQVLRQAPWFLDLLVREIAACLDTHGHCELLFIHGWNIGQAKCDIGIGVSEHDGVWRQANGAGVTINDAYKERLARLRAALVRDGVTVSLGLRYPASHPNNLLQLFTAHARHAEHPAVAQLADWARAGRIDALQLELGIPLRWPGPRRERFLDTVAAALVDSPNSTFPPSAASAVNPPAASSLLSGALQFYDAAADVGLSVGIGRSGPNTRGGRLLLFLGGQRVALFTGEEMWADACAVAPLSWVRHGDALELQFAGPILRLSDGTTYLDLEAALAASDLIDVTIALRFVPIDGWQDWSFGAIEGTVEVDGIERAIRTGAFVTSRGWRTIGPTQQAMIGADFGGDGILARSAVDGSSCQALHMDADGTRTLAGTRLCVSSAADGFTPTGFEMHCEGSVARGVPMSRMAILRGGPGGYLRVSFGVARFEWKGRAGYGLYEYAVPLESRQ